MTILMITWCDIKKETIKKNFFLAFFLFLWTVSMSKRGRFVSSSNVGANVSESSDDGSVVDRTRYRELSSRQHEWAVVSQELDERVTRAEETLQEAFTCVNKQNVDFANLKNELDRQVRELKKARDVFGSVEQLKVLKKQARAKELQSNLDSVTGSEHDEPVRKKVLLQQVKDLAHALEAASTTCESLKRQVQRTTLENNELQTENKYLKKENVELSEHVLQLEAQGLKYGKDNETVRRELVLKQGELSKMADKAAALKNTLQEQKEQMRLNQTHLTSLTSNVLSLSGQIELRDSKLSETALACEAEKKRVLEIELQIERLESEHKEATAALHDQVAEVQTEAKALKKQLRDKRDETQKLQSRTVEELSSLKKQLEEKHCEIETLQNKASEEAMSLKKQIHNEQCAKQSELLNAREQTAKVQQQLDDVRRAAAKDREAFAKDCSAERDKAEKAVKECRAQIKSKEAEQETILSQKQKAEAGWRTCVELMKTKETQHNASVKEISDERDVVVARKEKAEAMLQHVQDQIKKNKESDQTASSIAHERDETRAALQECLEQLEKKEEELKAAVKGWNNCWQEMERRRKKAKICNDAIQLAAWSAKIKTKQVK
jgi:synaptonemal complex protein ZIP1